MKMGLEGDNVLNDSVEFGGAGVGGGAEEKATSAEDCSICLDVVTDDGKRSWAMLDCSHQFHLDCIVSAFNAKKSMQCPNCRNIIKGEWLYSDESRLCHENTINRRLIPPEDQFDWTAASCCSICRDIVTTGRRSSWAKLKCSHQFHLGCIGPVINGARGAMQCPNCHNVEKGRWLRTDGLLPIPINLLNGLLPLPPLRDMLWRDYGVVLPIQHSHTDQGESSTPTTNSAPTSAPHISVHDETCNQQSGNQVVSTQVSDGITSSSSSGTRSNGQNNKRIWSSRRGNHHHPQVYQPAVVRHQNMHRRYAAGNRHSRNR